tara:strand:- start:352 stop:1164 length:813 start_codon:yes stop_codon:yes gene_type:complete
MTNKIKSLLRKIFYIKKIKNFIIFLLRKKLISRRFRNLIQLNGFNNIFKSNIDIFNSNSDAVSRDLCIYGVTKKEEEIFSKFIEVIKNSNSFLDIGAGIGLYTLFAIKLNPNISSLSIEANPAIFKILNKNLNNLQEFNSNHKVINKFVSQQKLNIEFYVPKGDDFSYGTSEKQLLEEKNIPFETIIVDTTQISEFKNSKFEIIKIDVEGSELDVLYAIEKHLKYCNLLFIEIIDSQKKLIYDFLESNKFKPLVESKDKIGNYIFISNTM